MMTLQTPLAIELTVFLLRWSPLQCRVIIRIRCYSVWVKDLLISKMHQSVVYCNTCLSALMHIKE